MRNLLTITIILLTFSPCSKKGEDLPKVSDKVLKAFYEASLLPKLDLTKYHFNKTLTK